jgi:polysaccharide chain length determinant protein (PEP-CTERM system associated)
MINQEQRQQLKRILDIFLRRKKIIIFCIIIALVLGLGKYLKTPKVYRSTSLIIYQQKINPTQMSPDTNRFGEIVSTVSQQIASRTSLENLINQFDLYKGLRAGLPMEDVVEIMRNSHIKIKTDRRGKTFSVSYIGGNPRKVLLVTNALAAKFIEENIRFREETVTATSAYIKDELSMAKESMNKIDAAMRDYKLNYYNEMPRQLDSNISRLNALQEQYQNYQVNLQDLERTKILIQEQISLRKEFLSQAEGSTQGFTGQRVLSKSAQLNMHRLELENLQSKYTDKHPDVKRLKVQIDKLEVDLAEKNTTTDIEAETETVPGGIGVRDNQIFNMQQQLETIEYNMGRLNSEREETKKQIEKYKKWIEAAPIREAEWSDLTRDYEQLRKHYETLVQRDLQAVSAQSLERRQKGSQFKIFDPANLAEKPFKPDFEKIMLMAIAISLGIGGAIAFALELLDTTFRDAHDLEKFLGIPVACSIPVIKTATEIRKQNIKSGAWITVLILSLGAIWGGMAYLWVKGTIVL